MDNKKLSMDNIQDYSKITAKVNFFRITLETFSSWMNGKLKAYCSIVNSFCLYRKEDVKKYYSKSENQKLKLLKVVF